MFKYFTNFFSILTGFFVFLQSSKHSAICAYTALGKIEITSDLKDLLRIFCQRSNKRNIDKFKNSLK